MASLPNMGHARPDPDPDHLLDLIRLRQLAQAIEQLAPGSPEWRRAYEDQDALTRKIREWASDPDEGLPRG